MKKVSPFSVVLDPPIARPSSSASLSSPVTRDRSLSKIKVTRGKVNNHFYIKD
jgi:hypothetical protein